jgi:hypothetical protein
MQPIATSLVLSRPEALASTARFIRYAVDANKSLKQKENQLHVFFLLSTRQAEKQPKTRLVLFGGASLLRNTQKRHERRRSKLKKKKEKVLSIPPLPLLGARGQAICRISDIRRFPFCFPRQRRSRS